MDYADGLPLPGRREATQFGIREPERPVFSPGNLRICLPDHDQPLIVAQQAAPVGKLCLNGTLHLVAAVIGASLGILYTVTVAPEHGKAPVRIRIRTAAGSPHPDLFSVIDKRRSGGKNIEVGCHLHLVACHGQITRRAVCVMICHEGHHHGIRVEAVHLVQILLHVSRIDIDISFFRRLGYEPFRLGGGEVEAVHGGIVLVRHAVRIPDLTHRVDLGVDLPEFLDIPFPEIHASAVFPEVDVFRRIKAESVHTQIHVVFCHIQHSLPDIRAVEIQLRHIPGEIAFVEILTTGDLLERPARRGVLPATAVAVVFIVRACRVALPVRPDKLPEPGMEGPGMIDGKIQDQLDAPFVAEPDQFLQILHGAELRVNGVIIIHVVLVIGLGFEDRREPDAFDSQTQPGGALSVIEIVHAFDNAFQVSDAVPVGIREGSHENLIEHTIVILGRCRAGKFRVVDNRLALFVQAVSA